MDSVIPNLPERMMRKVRNCKAQNSSYLFASAVTCVALVVLVSGCQTKAEKVEAGTGEVEAVKKADSSSTETDKAISSADKLDQSIAENGTPAEKEAAARKRFNSLESNFKSELAALQKEIAATSSEEDKFGIYEEGNPVPVFVEQLLKLANRFPETSVAFDATMAAVGYAEGSSKDVAMNLMLDQSSERLDHLKVLESLLAEVPSQDVENWFRKLIASAPPGVVHARILLGFKTYFDQIPIFQIGLDHNPQVVQRLPAEQVAYIRSGLTDDQEVEIEKYLQAVIDEYADLETDNLTLDSSDTLGEAAERGLFELKHLGIGKVAPDIVGKDLDGEPFRLSDYRGKVVMLDFWGHWCPPCRRMYPHERHLVQRLAGLPFSLVGVNSDEDLPDAQKTVREDNLPWRNFWNGPEGTAGPIASQWNITAWPTIYLIDGDGIVRYKNLQGADLDRAIQKLMSEMGYEVDLSHDDVASR